MKPQCGGLRAVVPRIPSKAMASQLRHAWSGGSCSVARLYRPACLVGCQHTVSFKLPRLQQAKVLRTSWALSASRVLGVPWHPKEHEILVYAELSQAVGKYVRVNWNIFWGLLAVLPQDSIQLSAYNCLVLIEMCLSIRDIHGGWYTWYRNTAEINALAAVGDQTRQMALNT